MCRVWLHFLIWVQYLVPDVLASYLVAKFLLWTKHWGEDSSFFPSSFHCWVTFSSVLRHWWKKDATSNIHVPVCAPQCNCVWCSFLNVLLCWFVCFVVFVFIIAASYHIRNCSQWLLTTTTTFVDPTSVLQANDTGIHVWHGRNSLWLNPWNLPQYSCELQIYQWVNTV